MVFRYTVGLGSNGTYNPVTEIKEAVLTKKAGFKIISDILRAKSEPERPYWSCSMERNSV